MLRSILKVRNFSGCRRRLKASAARPKAVKSLHSKRRRPSSKVKRSPATALSRISDMEIDMQASVDRQGSTFKQVAQRVLAINFHIDPAPSQSQFAGQHIVVM